MAAEGESAERAPNVSRISHRVRSSDIAGTQLLDAGDESPSHRRAHILACNCSTLPSTGPHSRNCDAMTSSPCREASGTASTWRAIITSDRASDTDAGLPRYV